MQVKTRNTGVSEIPPGAVGLMVPAGLNSAPVKSAEKQPLCGSTGLYVMTTLPKRGRAGIPGRFVRANKSTSAIISRASNSCGDLTVRRAAGMEISAGEVPLLQETQ